MSEPKHTVKSDVEIMERFLIDGVLPLLTPTGVYCAQNPAPLRASGVLPVFERIAQNPAYRHQHFETATWDRKVVTLIDGEVSEQPIEGTDWEKVPELFERGR